MLKTLFAGKGGRKRLKFPHSSEGGGRNNIKLNPVFRGMVRHHLVVTDSQPKENCA
jgi:hypothetical protein